MQTRLTALDLIGYAAGDERPRQFVHMPEQELEQELVSIKVSYLTLPAQPLKTPSTPPAHLQHTLSTLPEDPHTSQLSERQYVISSREAILIPKYLLAKYCAAMHTDVFVILFGS